MAALIVIGGFIGYWLWPPSAGYLFHQAETLMASSHRSDWLTAREEYFDALDRKHPDHPYKEQLQKWRDKILLDEAEGRARNLSSKVQTQFSEPHTNAERQYVSFDTLAAKAVDAGNEVAARTTGARWPGCSSRTTPRSGPGTCWHSAAPRNWKPGSRSAGPS